MINNYIKKFIEYYTKKSKEFVKSYLDEGSLQFLDMQVRSEKKYMRSIEIANKNDRESFKNIIKKFLDSNFYYISQKYLLYRFLYDVNEPFSEEIEKKLNEIVRTNLEKEEIKKLIENTYDKIFDEFRKTVFQNYKDGKIYGKALNYNRFNFNNNNNNFYGTNNNNYKNNFNKHFDLHKKENKYDLECPYPPFDKKY